MKITHLPDTRIRGGYAVTKLEIHPYDYPPGLCLVGEVFTLFGPLYESWSINGEWGGLDDPTDMRNLVLTDEHRRLIAEAKGGVHE